MKIISFVIRLDSNHFFNDQNKINSFIGNVKFVKSSVSFVDGKSKFWTLLIHYRESDSKSETLENQIQEFSKSETGIILNPPDLLPKEKKITERLKEWRRQRGEKERLPLFMIITNSDIDTIAKKQPKDVSDFFGLKGFGQKKIERYASDIIALLNSI
ncbi:MAG: HRDC domain-containing protein [Moheibacter sp.]